MKKKFKITVKTMAMEVDYQYSCELPLSTQIIKDWHRIPTEAQYKMKRFLESPVRDDLRTIPFMTNTIYNKLLDNNSANTTSKLLGKFYLLDCQLDSMMDYLQDLTDVPGTGNLRLLVQALALKTLLLFGWQ